MDVSRRTDAGLGAFAGLVGGLAVAAVLAGQGRLDLSEPLRVDPPIVGWLAFLLLNACGGALYGWLFRFQPGRLAASVGGGLLFGLLWWAGIWLTVIPLITATGPGWSVAEASTTFPLLIANVLTWGIAALVFHATGTRVIGDRALTGPVAATGVHIRHRVVIVGGGFGGVATAQRLEQLLSHRPDVAVTLISESNFLLFTPMLAGVASGSLVARHVAAPLRATCQRTTIRRATVETVDTDARTVQIRSSHDTAAESIPFDQLVLAVGAVPAFRGLSDVAARAFTLKTLADATELRDHVIGLLDRAENEPAADVRRRLLTFAVAGGGFAGVELVAELHDLVRDVLVYHPRIEPDELRFVLIHSRDRILPELSVKLGAYALELLRRRGIEFELGVRVTGASRGGVSLSNGASVATETFVWTAGNEPAPLVRSLMSEAGGSVLATDENLRVEGFQDIWAVGDCASIPDSDRDGQPCPPTAQHALRQGHQAADNLVAAMDGRQLRPFRFRALGMLVVLGHNTAAAEIRGLRFSGLLAWFLWRGIYLAKLPGLEKKVRVLIDWLLDLVFPRDIVIAGSQDARRRGSGGQGGAS
ncbi:MAG: NAD(P)/FAD-dependent oxidoreductase [Chloroflexi bacterium]|nr:NAD(P)/FAD-dependent oxidoreductase [Chloroflexota bacterium]